MTENFFGITDRGKQRDNNEDTFIAEKVLKDRYVMACVIDGVGGYEGGEIAAQIARETILKYFSIPSGEIPTMMKEAIRVANEKIHEEKIKSRDHKGMACVVTLVITDMQNKKFYYAHIGDTRLYLFRDQSLVKITKDHSFVGFLEDSGRLSEEEAMSHPKRNEINKALGFDISVSDNNDYAEIGESPFLPGDILLLCSDGLSDMINREKMSSILVQQRSLEEKGSALIAAANDAGGKDNITVVLVQNTDKPLKQKATKPNVVKKKNVPLKEEPEAHEQEKQTEVYRAPLIRGRNAIRILTVCCGLLLGALIWSFFRWKPEEETGPTEAAQNAQEKKLSDTLSLAGTTTLLLSEAFYPQPVVLTDTLVLQKDSLYILGNQKFTLKADSTFRGPAIMIAPQCSYILLESIVFENFDVGILTQNKSLHLKNVQFKNCRVPVEYQMIFPNNSYVTGSFGDSLFIKTDTLPNQD